MTAQLRPIANWSEAPSASSLGLSDCWCVQYNDNSNRFVKKNLKRIKNLKTQSKEKKPPIQKPKIRAALRKGDGQTKISNNYDTSTIQSDANTKVEEDNENIYNSKERKFEKEGDLNSIIDQLIKTALLDSKTAGYDGDVSDTQVEVDGISDPSDDEGDSMDNSLDLVDIPSEEIDFKMGGV